MRQKNYSYLSGGEQSRVQLAKLLLSSPDVLLLDEPTNHLDIETIEWLEGFIKAYKGSVLIISHDRLFLDSVVDKIYELKPSGVETYFGNYSYYLNEKQVRYENQLKHYEVNQKELNQMAEAAKRMRDWAARGDNEMMYKKAKAMEKRMERMEKIDKPMMDAHRYNMAFNLSNQAGKVAFETDRVEIKIENHSLITSGSLKILSGLHVGIVGSNGSGKTTLMKRLLEGNSGIRMNPSLKIGYLPQNIVFKGEGKDLIETYRHYHPLPDGEIRNRLAFYDFQGEQVFKTIEALSGGEKMRLMLAILIAQPINCLFLDEPTNHIDIKTREILESAIDAFEGTVIFISHDRYFLKKCANIIVEIYKQNLLQFQGAYDDYIEDRITRHASVDRTHQEINEGVNTNKSQSIPRENKQNNKRANPVTLAYYEKDIEAKEKEIARLKGSLSEITDDYVALNEVLKQIEETERALDEVLEKYLPLL